MQALEEYIVGFQAMARKDISEAIKQFGQETTIHGIFILAKYKLHILERVFWVTIITLAAGCAIALCLSNWRRYSANPTVVSLQKDFRNWNNPFPAATGCFIYKTDDALTDEFIDKTWGVNYSHPKYDYYVDFVKAVANISFQSLAVFSRFQNDTSVGNIDMMELAAKVHPELTGTLVTFDSQIRTQWKLIVTEIGICFTVNSLFAEVLSYRPNGIDKDEDGVYSNNQILKCHYLNGLCYARYDSDPDAPVKNCVAVAEQRYQMEALRISSGEIDSTVTIYETPARSQSRTQLRPENQEELLDSLQGRLWKWSTEFYIHSYLDVLHATADPPWYVRESQEVEINYRMQETVSDLSLRSLTPSQRKCRFEDEPITRDVPAYSKSICYMVCRHRMVLKYCGCRPYFYHNLGGKVCDIGGLLCVAKYATTLTQPPIKLGCNCPQPCNIVTYLPQIPKINFWEYGYFDQRITFRWGLLPPTTKYHRNVLFGFEDLVVSFGGTVALFLGISFISVIEIILFIIESVFYFCCSINLNKSKDCEAINDEVAKENEEPKTIRQRVLKRRQYVGRIVGFEENVNRIRVQGVHNEERRSRLRMPFSKKIPFTN